MKQENTPVGTTPTVFYSPDVPTNLVPTGFPSPASDYLEQTIDLSTCLIEHPAATFIMRYTEGEAMRGAHIVPDALLIIDRALTPHHGDIVLVVVEGEFVVRRLEKREGKIRLLPENEKYSPIEVTKGRDIYLWGVVAHIILKTRPSKP